MDRLVEANGVTDAIIVGGGVAGLTAAALIARGGRSVTVMEQSGHVGGRATTQTRQGIRWNLGAHALYCHGQAFQLFRELGVPFEGRIPSPGRALLVAGDGLTPFPSGLGSLAVSRLFTVSEKARLVWLLTRLPGLETSDLDGVSLRDWLDDAAMTGHLRDFLACFSA